MKTLNLWLFILGGALVATLLTKGSPSGDWANFGLHLMLWALFMFAIVFGARDNLRCSVFPTLRRK